MRLQEAVESLSAHRKKELEERERLRAQVESGIIGAAQRPLGGRGGWDPMGFVFTEEKAYII